MLLPGLTLLSARTLISISEPERKSRGLAAAALVVRYTAAAGTNLCAVFHPREYVRGTLARGLDLVDFVAEGAKGNPRQDLYLIRKH